MTDGYGRGSSRGSQRALALGLMCLMVSPAAAQNPLPATGPTVVDQLPKGGPNLPPLSQAAGDRAPSVSYGLGILNDLKPGWFRCLRSRRGTGPGFMI